MKKYTATAMQHISSCGIHIKPGQEFYAERGKGLYSDTYLLSWTKGRGGIFATVHESVFEALTA